MCQAIEAANPAAASQGPPKPGKEGVRDAKMGVCNACAKPIFGVLIQVGDKDLHPGTERNFVCFCLFYYAFSECHTCKRCKRVFADGESFVRDNSKHTICDSCVSAEHEKKVAARPPMQEEIQALPQTSMGKCGSCAKDIVGSAVTVLNGKYHEACYMCQKCKRQLKRGDGCVREGNGFLCENCC
jgi:hypothetical protein